MKQNQQQEEDQNNGISTELTLFSSNHQRIIYKKPDQNKISRPTLLDEVSGRDDTSVSTLLSLSWIIPKPELPRLNLGDPWKIKKKLKGSDLGNLSRLLFPSGSVNKHILPLLRKEQIEMVVKEGFKVRVWDCDTRSEHNLVFKRWGSSKGYVFLNGWIPEFVKRRNLKEDDNVGVYWDVSKSRFNFSVLRKASNSHVVHQ